MTANDFATFRGLSCTDVSDALDRLGIAGQCLGVMPLDTKFKMSGRAWTLRYGPCGLDLGSVGDYIDDLGPGQVVVIDNQGRLDATVWGDLLTSTAAARKVAGTVIDGICRDIDRALETNYPIFARGNWMRTGKDRVRVEATSEPVSIGGVRIESGDYVLGDGDGVVSVPATRITEVITVAREIAEAEERVRQSLASGVSLREARRLVGYHTLQSRRF